MQSVERVQSFKMGFLFRFNQYFLVGVIGKAEGFFDVVGRDSVVFGEPGLNDGGYNFLLHELG